jgi:hypothetical protein
MSFVTATNDGLLPTNARHLAFLERSIENVMHANSENTDLHAHAIYHWAKGVYLQGDEPGREITLTPLDGIAPARARWLWNLRVPLGAITLLGGREGEGKSTIAIDLIAQASRGELEGEYLGKPRNSIIVATEDSLRHTIIPRLLAADANMKRVFDLKMEDEGEQISLDVDIPELIAECARRRDIALIVFDPLLSRLGKLDTHKDSEVRQALEPLKVAAEEIGAAVLGLIHPNKSGSTDPLQTIMGSRAFTAVSRAVLYVVVDPEDQNQHLLGLAKSNLGPLNVPTKTYTFDPIVVGEDDGPIIATRIAWGKDVETRIGDALEASTENRSAIQDAMEWLTEYLTTVGGEAKASVALAEGKKAGHNDKTLRRARERLGYDFHKVGMPGVVVWSIPGYVKQVTAAQIEASRRS